MYREQALENFYMVKEASKAKLVRRLRGSNKMGGVIGLPYPIKRMKLDPARKRALEADLAKKLKNPEAHGVETKSLNLLG